MRSLAFACVVSGLCLSGAVHAEEPADAIPPAVAAPDTPPIDTGSASPDYQARSRQPLLNTLVTETLGADYFGSDAFVTLTIAPEWNFWDPGITTKQEKILDFSSEGFEGFRIAGAVGPRRDPAIAFEIRRPFTFTINQKSLLEEDGDTGMESLQFALRGGAVVGGLLRMAGVDGKLVDVISTIKGSYLNQTFIGNATAARDAKLLLGNAQLSPNGRGGYYITNPAESVEDITAGKPYYFKTTFEDFEATVDIVPLLERRREAPKGIDVELRLGGYSAEWTRPKEYDGWTFTSGGSRIPIVEEAKYRTRGVLMRIGYRLFSDDEQAAGGLGVQHNLDMKFDLRFGVDDDIEKALPSDTKVQFVGLRVAAAYSMEFDHGRFFIMPGASFDFRSFLEKTKDANGNIQVSDNILDGEKLTQVYVRAGLRF